MGMPGPLLQSLVEGFASLPTVIHSIGHAGLEQRLLERRAHLCIGVRY
jgi:hypothetical protein